MNIIILSNAAPNYHKFFNSLSLRLEDDGHKIFYAVDSETSVSENKIEETGFSYSVFSTYFAKHKTDYQVLEKYKKYNLNAALLSDYERAKVYKIWGRRDNDFYERLKSALLCFFIELFNSKKIDVVIYENVSNAFAHFCWFVCQEHGVRYLGMTGSRLPGRFWITDDPYAEGNRIDKTFQGILSGEIKPHKEILNWCREYVEKIEDITPDYMKFNGLDNTSLSNKYLNKKKLKKLKIVARHTLDDHYHSFQRGNPLNMSFQLFFRNFKRNVKIKKITKYYNDVVNGEKYFLYPIHFHPESSTSILSGTYLDEFEVIRNIAFNLPQGYKLYVKDHISAFGYPSLDFYKKIDSLPNVRLLPPKAPTKKLIRNSEAVITLTSTVGYEALLLEKHVFLFGQVFYESHKNVIKIDDPSKIFDLINKWAHDKELDYNISEYNVSFVAAYYMNTLQGQLNMMLESREAERLIEELYPAIKTVLNEKPSKNTIDIANEE